MADQKAVRPLFTRGPLLIFAELERTHGAQRVGAYRPHNTRPMRHMQPLPDGARSAVKQRLAAAVAVILDAAELKTPVFLGLAVLFWLAGFDVIYSLQDRTFDLQQGLYSIPARFGIVAALQLSSFFHLCTAIFLALVGLAAQLGIIYWLGFAAVAAILFWEHRIVTPTDLSRVNRAFFDFNAYVSIGYFLITAGDLLLNARLGN